jgi:hypothetical protein
MTANASCTVAGCRNAGAREMVCIAGVLALMLRWLAHLSAALKRWPSGLSVDLAARRQNLTLCSRLATYGFPILLWSSRCGCGGICLTGLRRCLWLGRCFGPVQVRRCAMAGLPIGHDRVPIDQQALTVRYP